MNKNDLIIEMLNQIQEHLNNNLIPGEFKIRCPECNNTDLTHLEGTSMFLCINPGCPKCGNVFEVLYKSLGDDNNDKSE